MKKKQTKKSKVYDYTDEIIRAINAMIVVQFTALNVADFDELHTLDSVNLIYRMIDMFTRSELYKLYEDSYKKAAKVAGASKSEQGNAIYGVDGILSTSNPVTRYVYVNEYDRKRTRCYESLMSTTEKVTRDMLIMTAVKALSRQIKEYCNLVTYDAMLTAYQDNDVKKVRWVALDDDRICEECEDLDGTIFTIDRVPSKPHINCRCWLVPVK